MGLSSIQAEPWERRVDVAQGCPQPHLASRAPQILPDAVREFLDLLGSSVYVGGLRDGGKLLQLDGYLSTVHALQFP